MALMVEVVTKSEAQKVVCTTVVKISANLTVNYLCWFFWFGVVFLVSVQSVYQFF